MVPASKAAPESFYPRTQGTCNLKANEAAAGDSLPGAAYQLLATPV